VHGMAFAAPWILPCLSQLLLISYLLQLSTIQRTMRGAGQAGRQASRHSGIQAFIRIPCLSFDPSRFKIGFGFPVS
jgi:hypothetical protein